MSNEEENIAVVRRWWEEVWNQGNTDVVDELVSPDFVLTPMWPNPVVGRPQDTSGFIIAKQVTDRWRESFPDIWVKVEDIFAEGDKVATRHRSGATQLGAFQGNPPSGKYAEITGMTLMHMSDGKIVHSWTCWDLLSMLQQLDVLPKQGPAG